MTRRENRSPGPNTEPGSDPSWPNATNLPATGKEARVGPFAPGPDWKPPIDTTLARNKPAARPAFDPTSWDFNPVYVEADMTARLADQEAAESEARTRHLNLVQDQQETHRQLEAASSDPERYAILAEHLDRLQRGLGRAERDLERARQTIDDTRTQLRLLHEEIRQWSAVDRPATEQAA